MQRRLSGAGWVLACVGVLGGLVGCADDDTVDQAPQASASATPSVVASSALPSKLVGQWDVEGSGVEPGTIMTFSTTEAIVFLDCGLAQGSWRSLPGGAFLADLYGGSGSCEPVDNSFTPPWLEQASSFAVLGERRELRAADGRVLVTLRPAATRPELPDTVIDDYADPPVLTEQDRAKLDRPLPGFPAGIRPAEPSELLGTWVRPGETGEGDNWPHATFRDDGRWIGSDGCNGLGSRWALVDGALLTGDGVSTLIGCENIALLAGAVLAGFDGETLVLLDEQGKETHRVVRGPAPREDQLSR